MPSEKYSLPLSSLRLANARTATDLLVIPFVTGGWINSLFQTIQPVVAARVIRDAARARRVRWTWLGFGEERCRHVANSWVPGRDAGSNASIDPSSDLRRCGTCAALSCSVGSTSDF